MNVLLGIPMYIKSAIFLSTYRFSFIYVQGLHIITISYMCGNPVRRFLSFVNRFQNGMLTSIVTFVVVRLWKGCQNTPHPLCWPVWKPKMCVDVLAFLQHGPFLPSVSQLEQDNRCLHS